MLITCLKTSPLPISAPKLASKARRRRNDIFYLFSSRQLRKKGPPKGARLWPSFFRVKSIRALDELERSSVPTTHTALCVWNVPHVVAMVNVPIKPASQIPRQAHTYVYPSTHLHVFALSKDSQCDPTGGCMLPSSPRTFISHISCRPSSQLNTEWLPLFPPEPQLQTLVVLVASSRGAPSVHAPTTSSPRTFCRGEPPIERGALPGRTHIS